MPLNLKTIILTRLFARWGKPRGFEPGYTVLLPMPMDMPFLLRFALEMLQRMQMPNCKQILVIPDGLGTDCGAALLREIDAIHDSRIELVKLGRIDYFVANSMKPRGGSGAHWLAIVNGIKHARCEHIFLHDADAFFRDATSLERLYETCRGKQMNTLGVTPRWDPFFTQLNYAIPGTWEMMFSAKWVRRWSPYSLKGVWQKTPHGPHEFDTMLYPQYADYDASKFGCLEPPPQFVHFNGTIVTYRLFRDAGDKQVIDELFRVLLLALLEDLVPSADGKRVVPRVDELANGLTDERAPVVYTSETAKRGYATFRKMIEELCDAPIFQGERAAAIREKIAPFDEHFAALADAAGGDLGPPIDRLRVAGLATK